jgi:purine-binding chemotaxis protein CheW
MQYCTFYLDQKHYGIPMMEVQEVILQQELTPVPLASSVVRGLMNLRGSIVLSIDMRRRLGLPEAGEDQESIQIITQGPAGLVGWMVDQMGEVADLDPGQGEMPPGTVPAASREVMRSVFQLETGLLMVLDGQRILEMEQERHEGVREGARELA